MHHGIGHMVMREGGPVLGGGRSQPPPPSQGQRSITSPGQGQRSTTSPWPGSKINHPLARVKGQPPPPQDTCRYYGQWAGGTHPTGMHSSLLKMFTPYNKDVFVPSEMIPEMIIGYIESWFMRRSE